MNYLIQVYKILGALFRIAERGDVTEIRFGESFIGCIYFLHTGSRWRLQVSRKKIKKVRFTVVFGRERKLHTDCGSLLYSDDVRAVYDRKGSEYSFLLKDKPLQSELLSHARKVAESVLKNEVKIYSHSKKTVEVCVAFWKYGQVRGSMMGGGNTLIEAVTDGVVKTLTLDERWKPLTLVDLEDAQIEIAVFSPFRLEIDFDREYLDHTKGYIARYGDKSGLYVPEVFNAARFEHKDQFIRTLLVEKGGIPWMQRAETQIFAFNVCDFIEETPRGGALLLEASMGESVLREVSDFKNEVAGVVQRGILWLQKIQEDDGNIPPIVYPFSQKKGQVDWSRFAFVVYALTEWERVFPGQTEVAQVCRRALLYARMHITVASRTKKMYAMTYLAHAELTLGEVKRAVALAEVVVRELQTVSFQPILFLETLTLLERLEEYGVDVYSMHVSKENILEVCRKEFYKTRAHLRTDVASWAEAVVAFQRIDPDLSREIGQWICTHQQENGSFRQSLENPFAYTRGSAKLFEVLCSDPIQYGKTLKGAHAWLTSMQYDEKNTFFIVPSFRDEVIGGMRHDYGNPDLWIDSIGHYVLGASRLLSVKE